MIVPGRCSLILAALAACLLAWAQPEVRPPDRESVAAQLERAEERLSAMTTVPAGSPEAEQRIWADLHMELMELERMEVRHQTEGKQIDVPGDSGWPALYWREVEANRESVRDTARRSAERVAEMRRLFRENPRATTADHDRLARILEDPRFVYAKADEEWMKALMRRLGGWFGKIFRPELIGAAWVTNLATLILVAVLVVIAAAVVWFGVIRRWRGRVRRRRGGQLQEETAPPPRPVEMRRLAEEALAAGRYRDALHFHYVALLLTLSELDLVPFSSSRTNREIVRYLRRRQAPREAVGRIEGVTSNYDRIWYGSGECGESEVRAAAGEIDVALAELVG